MENSAEFKKAAIDWLLTNGTCDSMDTSTGTALADLTVRGVDYEASETPDFRSVAIEPGDSFHEATWGEAFACTVYPLGYDKTNWREGYTFWVGDQDIKRIFLGQMITGLIAAAETGDSGWKARAHQPEVERLLRHQAAEAERAARLAEARAAKDNQQKDKA